MLQNFLITVLLFLFSGVSALIFGQTTIAVKPTVIVGDVVTVSDKLLIVNTKTGPVPVTTNEQTAFKKVSAENPNFATAAAGKFSDIGIGDKLTISGFPVPETKSFPARSVYFMTKADIDAKAAKESGEWQRRGIKGKVITANAQTNQINLEISGVTGTTKMVVTPKEGAKFLRYAPDSVMFEEAVASSVGETQPGDLVRALGDKSSDGLSFSAEQLIVGAFQTIAGTVKSIDVEKNELIIKDLQTNKDVTVVIGETSVLKRFPAEQAEMLARMQAMGAAGGGARPMGQGGGARPAGQGAPAGGAQQGQTPGGARPGPGGGRGGPGAGSVDDMLDRSPNIKVGDLKAGDIIAFSSSKSSQTTRVRAIKLYAGVEPFLRAAQASSGRGRGGQGGGTGFSIPGLDGGDFP